jgi:anti-sigma regulatory factor (Ser/Thr protein kinase)
MREHGAAASVSPSGQAQLPNAETHRKTERSGLEHLAMLYGDPRQYLAGACAFLEAGDEAHEALMVAIPGAKIEPLRAALGGTADRVRFLDMNELGRNPGRIIPEVGDWIDGQGDRRCRFIGEPIWPQRSEAERIEATRHEALVNLAFADAAVSILCPYDFAGLDARVLADAERTHPHLICGSDHRVSAAYADPLDVWLDPAPSPPEPEETMATLSLAGNLGKARRIAEACGRAMGLSSAAAHDLVLAVDEAATNALRHGAPPAELRVWREPAGIVCEVTDHGRLEDPLAGRRRPAPDWPSGRGLWLINQLCDLVELRPVAGGTAIRMHWAAGA